MAVLFLAAWLCAQAYGAVFITTNILADQTWTATNSPYYICYWDCTVLSNVMLTIEPGVTVILGKGQDIGWGHYLSEQLKVQGTFLYVYADLTIAGASGEPVRLTSVSDTAAGNGVEVPNGYGQVWIRHTAFDNLAAGLHIAWASSATARVDIAHSTFSNITGIAIKMENEGAARS